MNYQLASRDQRRARNNSAHKAGTFVSHVKVLKESGNQQKRVYEVVVIEAGESLNRRYYPEETLQQATRLFDGKSVHAFRFSDKELNHLPEMLREQTPLGGPLGNKIGTLRNPRWNEQQKAVIAELHVPINNTTQWFIDMADSSLALQEPQFGFSIDGQGEAFPKKIRGRVVEWVERLSDIFSLDAVSNPAAGGRLLAQAIVENVVGDPSLRLRQYEDSLGKAGKIRFTAPRLIAKPENIRFGLNLTEGVNMRFWNRSSNSGDQLVRKLIRTLSGESEHPARAVVRSLRLAESLSQSGAIADLNVDRLQRQLESIQRPSRNVRTALSQLRTARTSSTPRTWLSEQDQLPPDPLISQIPQDPMAPQAQPADTPTLVDDLMKLLEQEIDQPAQEVFSTLKKAKEFSDTGGSIELNIKDLLIKLQKIQEPTKNEMKAIKLLKDELKRMQAQLDGMAPPDATTSNFDLGSQLPQMATQSPMPSTGAGFAPSSFPGTTPQSNMPTRLPPLNESTKSGRHHRRLFPGFGKQENQSEVQQLRNDLKQKEHQERIREALSEAETNGLPRLISSELLRDLQNQNHLSERAIRRKINERIHQANSLMESVRPDFRDLSGQPHVAGQKSPIETTIFEAR